MPTTNDTERITRLQQSGEISWEINGEDLIKQMQFND